MNTSGQKIDKLITGLSRRQKQFVAMGFDFIAMPLALWSALVLRIGEWVPDVEKFLPIFVVSGLVSIPIFVHLGLYRHVVRHIGFRAVWAVLKGATIIALVVAAVAYMAVIPEFPRSVPVIFWLLTLLYVGGTRLTVRSYFHWIRRDLDDRKPVIIYGARSTGVELTRQLKQRSEFNPIAFIDDEKSLQKRIIDGLYVHAPRNLSELLEDTGARDVFISVDSAQAVKRREIIEFLQEFSVRVRLIPDIFEIISGGQSLVNIRDVRLEDLLERDPVSPLPDLMSGSVRDRVVLVTGAGGSIGSELCRQIVRQRPRHLVMLDQSEFGLYTAMRDIEAILDNEHLDVPITASLGSVINQSYMDKVISTNAVETIYHAAAYKHVSLVEDNIIEGLRNNSIGALYAAKAAILANVKDFILISTDKAVNTASVMGASKRLAEMTLQAMQEVSDTTNFSMVRFGNVLGSSGSVVPLFLEQIDAGGPVTVTHPEVSRYFMTIAEAATLVMQAASIAEGGDVFLLDMGKPIRIMDLAERMIRLKGYSLRDEQNPMGDIEIQITGLKPGEKLHEELVTNGQLLSTSHRKIMRARESFISWSDLSQHLESIEEACESMEDDRVQRLLRDLFNISI